MSFEFHVEQLTEKRIALRLQGWLEPDDVGAVTKEFLRLCQRYACTQVLYDIRGYIGRPNLGSSFGLASSLPHWSRGLAVAFVDDSAWNHYADHMQRVYQDLGFNAVFFSDVAAATRWLDERDA